MSAVAGDVGCQRKQELGKISFELILASIYQQVRGISHDFMSWCCVLHL